MLLFLVISLACLADSAFRDVSSLGVLTSVLFGQVCGAGGYQTAFNSGWSCQWFVKGLMDLHPPSRRLMR